MFAKKALAASVSAAPKVYVEDVFSTYLYTGNGSTQTITNGIDLSGEGGLVWMKDRTDGSLWHQLFDTARGGRYALATNATDQSYDLGGYPSRGVQFNSDGFSFIDTFNVGKSGRSCVSWTFRKAEKFFDVVTYTGNGSNRTISHNLGSVPGCIIVKRTDTAASWRVYHRSLTDASYFLSLNLTDGQTSAGSIWNSTAPTSTVFSVGTSSTVNENGGTYVAYLFAHDAAAFGDAGDQSIIKCGSYTGNGSATGPTITLDWEPQWLLIKKGNDGGPWYVLDNMRGIVTGGNDNYLQPNSSGAENVDGAFDVCQLNSTGFQIRNSGTNTNENGFNYIYIAIRRGPMKTPEAGTDVFDVGLGTSATTSFASSFPPDLAVTDYKPGGLTIWPAWFSRLTGDENYVRSSGTNAEAQNGNGIFYQGGFGKSDFDSDFVGWLFRRAPGFFDVVCYTGTGSARTVSHNLGVAPELMIVKRRNGVEDWAVYPNDSGKWLKLNLTDAIATTTALWNNTAPTSSVFTVNTDGTVNSGSGTYVAYLFASVTGVSKVGSYTGTGTTLQINCGFTAGARFVLIKRTDSTGDWYVWDTARGIVSGNDPYLLLNSTAAEVTNTDYIDTYSSGFEISSTAPAAINANGGTFIFLAVA